VVGCRDGLAGLGKETNLLAAVALPLPRRATLGEWAGAAGRGLPWRSRSGSDVDRFGIGWAEWRCGEAELRLALWPTLEVGGNLEDASDRGYWLRGAMECVDAGCDDRPVGVLCAATALHDPWWRLGASYAVLMMFLGSAVWEGYPARPRACFCPLGLAFNVLCHADTTAVVAVLFLGNLTLLSPRTS